MPLVLAVLAVIATLAAILLMNVRVSDGQYRLVELRSQERSLAQESEALTQDLEFYQAPQNLAIAASDEGMVPATSEGVVDLSSHQVSGEPTPATDAEKYEVLVAQPVQKGSAAADRAEAIARERRDALPESQAQADDQLRAANAAEQDVDLHGGSIPAPQQRSAADETATPSPSELPTGRPPSAGSSAQPEGSAGGQPAQPTATPNPAAPGGGQ